MNNEIVDSVKDALKKKLSSYIYGTFIIYWLVFHWKFVYTIFFISEDIVLKTQGLLKNEYLSIMFFDYKSLYFWASWVLPFLFTYTTIWMLPKYVLLKAFEKEEEYETNKRVFKISQEKMIESARANLEQQTAKKITAVAKQVVGERKIKEADPTIGWKIDFDDFIKTSFYKNFDALIQSIYQEGGSVTKFNDYGNLRFQVNKDLLAYAHTNDLIGFTRDPDKIALTEKGKFFVKQYSVLNNRANNLV